MSHTALTQEYKEAEHMLPTGNQTLRSPIGILGWCTLNDWIPNWMGCFLLRFQETFWNTISKKIHISAPQLWPIVHNQYWFSSERTKGSPIRYSSPIVFHFSAAGEMWVKSKSLACKPKLTLDCNKDQKALIESEEPAARRHRFR